MTDALDPASSPLLAGPQCRMVYASRVNTNAFEGDIQSEILRILETSQRYNRETMVGGLLLYADGYFCQILEGPIEAVEATYERIARDPRHQLCTVLLTEKIERRRYPGIPMALVGVDETPHPELQGLLDDPEGAGGADAGRELANMLEARINGHSLEVPMFLGKLN